MPSDKLARMTVTELRELLRSFNRQLGMYTVERSFLEACALVTGAVSAASVPGFHQAFADWLYDRVESDKPELAWHHFVSLKAVPGDMAAWRRDDVEDAVLSSTLFASLDEFLAAWDAPAS